MARLFSVNNSPATCCIAVFDLKTLLKTAGWTVPKSSDGLTYNSSGDQISHGGTGANGMDNVSAWFVVQMPGSSRSFCLQRYNSSGYGNYWRVKYSKAAGFVGGTPGIIRTPSAADEQVVIGGGTDASPSFIPLFNTADGTFRHNFFVDNVSPYGFMSWAWTKTAGVVVHAFGIDPLSGTFAEDTDPYVIHSIGDNTPFTMASFGLNGGQISGWWGTLWCLRLAGCPCATAGPPYSYGGGASVWASASNQVNIITGKDDLFPLTALGYQTTSLPYYKGVLTLVRAIGQPGRTSGDLYSVDAPKDNVAVGPYCALPWDGSSTPLV